MAGQSDTRIVQMQFENKQFEKNIAQSKKSLDELKSSMNFEETSKGLSKFAEGLDKLKFEGLINNIQKLTDKFTGLGTLSELVISQIRRKIEETAASISRFVDSMTTQQMSAGMMKYEQQNKSVQTIMAATGESEEEVYRVLGRLNEYTDQTSYNFADMAQNIGKFTSVGIKLEDAERQMEGIANWAARSGAGINEASRAMYNLSQAMGVGKLTLIDWKSIENAGMATKEFKEQLIESAVAAKTIEKTVDKNGKTIYKTAKNLGKQQEVTYQNLGTMLNKGIITRNVLSSTLEKYYWDDLYYEGSEAMWKLEKAQKEALDSMIKNDQKLSTDEYKTLEQMGVFTDEAKQKLLDLAVSMGKLTQDGEKEGHKLYKAVDKNGKEISFTLSEFAESIGKSDWFDEQLIDRATTINEFAKSAYESAQKCLTFSDVLNAWKDQISTGWMNSLNIVFGSLSESMEFFSNVCNRVGEAFDKLITFRNNLLQAWADNGGRQSLIDLILGDYGKDIKTGAFGVLDIFESVGNLIRDAFVDFISLFADPLDRHMLKNEPMYITAWLGARMNEITQKVQGFMQKIRDFFTAEIEVNGQSKSRLQVVHEIIMGIVGAMQFGYQVLSNAIYFFGQIWRQLSPGFNEIIALLGDLGVSVYNTADRAQRLQTIRMIFFNLAKTLQPVSTAINMVIGSIARLIRAIFGMEDGPTDFINNIRAIGDALVSVVGIISKVVSPIITFISRIIDAVSGLFQSDFSKEGFAQFGKDLSAGFNEMMRSFADSLPEGNFIGDFLKSIFGDKHEAEGAVDKESKSLFGLISGITNDAKQEGEQIQNETGGGGVMGLLTGGNIAVWLGVAALASVTLLINKARKTVGAIGKFFRDAGEALRNGIKFKYQDDTAATKFQKIAISIGIIAASVIGLGTIPLPNLLQGIAAVAVIMAGLFVMFKLLQKSIRAGKFGEVAGIAAQMTAMAFGMVMLGAAIGIIALALVPFTLMNWDQYARAMAGLGGILLQLAAFMFLVKALNVKNVKLNSFAAFAFSLGILVRSLQSFAGMNWDQYGRSMAGLGGVLLQMLAFMALAKVIPHDTGVMIGFAGFAFSVGILVQAIRPFAGMNWDQYARSMAGLGGVLLELLAFMALAKLVPHDTGSMIGFIGFALSVAILVQAIRPFAGMNWDQYARAMAGLGGVLLQLLAFMALAKVLGTYTDINMKGFIGFALSMAILIMSLQAFAGMNWDQYARVMAGLGGVLLEIAAFMGITKALNVFSNVNLGGFIAFALSIAILVRAIQPFAAMDWDQYGRSMAGLGGVLAELLAFMGFMKLMKVNESIKLGGLMGFAAALSALINALMPFSKLDWGQYAVVMAGLGGVLTIMLGFMALLKVIKPDVGGLLQMAIFAGIFAAVVGIFSAALALLKGVSWETIAAFSAGLSVLLVAVSGAGALAKAAGISGMLTLAAGLAAIIGMLALLAPVLMKSIGSGFQDMAANLTMISGLMEIFGGKMGNINEGDIDKGSRIIDKLGSLFEKIAGYRFSGGNVSTFRDAMANLNLTASQISLFSGKMAGLPDDGNVDKAKEIIGKVKDLFTNDLQGFDGYTGLASSFSTAMYELSTALGTWAFNTSDIGSPDDSNALKTIQALASTGSGLDTIAKLNLNDLTAKISGLGGAMMLYAKGAQEVDALGVDIPEGEEMPDVSGAIKLMQAISTSLSENGGFTIPSNMPDSDSLSLFGASLAAIAGALVQFEEAGQGLGDGTTEALRVLTFFRDLRTQLESTNFSENLAALDLEAFGTGDVAEGKADQLTVFGKNISALAQSMGQFANSTTYLDASTGEIKTFDYTNATTAIQSIVDAANNLPSFDGALETLTGRKEKLGDLSKDIELLGSALNDFHTQTTSTDDGIITEFKFDNAIEALNNLAAIPGKLPTIGGIKSWWEGNHQTLSEFGTDIGQVAVGLNLFSGAVNGTSTEGGEKFDATAAASAIGTLDSMVTLTQTLKQKLPKLGGIDSIAETLIHGRDVTLADLGDQIGKLGDGLGKLGAGIGNGNFSDNVGLKNAFDSLDSVLAVMQKLEQLSGMTGSGYANLDKLTYFVEGLTNMNQYEDGIKHNPIADSLVDFMTKINTAFIMADDDAGVFDNLKENMEIFKLFTQGLSALTNTNLDIDWGNIGTKLSTSVAAGIGNGTTDVITAVTGLMSAAQTEANSPAGVSFEPAGKAIATGVAAGIVNNTTVVTKAARTMALLAYYAAMAALNAHSPSKLFADVGSYIGLGMAQGIDSTNDTVVNSMTGMTDKTIESAGTMMATLSRIMAEGADANPTITPVLDLSQVEAGMGSLNGNFGDRTIGLSTSYSASQAGQLGWGSSDDSSQNGSQYNGIYERMNQLGEELMNLGKSISNMKLVLDSGVVAGGVTDDVDLNIGRKAFYAERNN